MDELTPGQLLLSGHAVLVDVQVGDWLADSAVSPESWLEVLPPLSPQVLRDAIWQVGHVTSSPVPKATSSCLLLTAAGSKSPSLMPAAQSRACQDCPVGQVGSLPLQLIPGIAAMSSETFTQR